MNSKGKRMVNEDLIKYLEAVKTNNPDPSDIGGGGTDFTATNGLLLQEIEGENYLGIDPAANIKGQLVFTTTNNNEPAITINALNNTNTDINFKSVYDNGEIANRARLRYVQGLNGHFELGSMINGSYATVKTPNASTLLEEDFPVTRTIALGVKGISGDIVTDVYAGNDGLIDFASTYDPIPFNTIQVYDTVTIGSYPDGTPGNTSLFIGTGAVETQSDTLDITSGDGNARITLTYDTSNDTPTYFFMFGFNEVSIKEDGIYYNQTKVVSFPTQS